MDDLIFYKILLPIVMKTAGRSIEWIIMRLVKVGAKVALSCKVLACIYRDGVSGTSP